jgi:hypothetical protein
MMEKASTITTASSDRRSAVTTTSDTTQASLTLGSNPNNVEVREYRSIS